VKRCWQRGFKTCVCCSLLAVGSGPDGSYREVLSALQINHPVSVLTYAEVMGQTHGDLAAFDAQHEADTEESGAWCAGGPRGRHRGKHASMMQCCC
jgi:hypothetical protein